MALKIDENMSATAYHITDGATVFPYAIDAQHAIAQHPKEWSADPWSLAAMDAAREEAGKPAIEVSPEEQAAIDEHATAVAEANARLEARREKLAKEKAEADQATADELLVRSPPPMPDLNKPKRPFGRAGDPTPAEMELIQKREAKKADDERVAREKADADAQANPNAKITS